MFVVPHPAVMFVGNWHPQQGMYVLLKGVGLILGLLAANERRRYFVTTSLVGWVQA